MLRRPVVLAISGAAALLLGAFMFVVSLRADELNLGGPPGLGFKQVFGIALGVTLAAAGAAGVVVALRDRPLRRSLATRLGPSVLIPFVALFAVYWAVFKVMLPPPTGDEPHYMLEAYSLAYDRDRDLRNDYGDPFRYGQPFGTVVPDVHFKPGTPYSVHHVGLPALLSVAVLFRHHAGTFRVELVLLAALTAVMLLVVMRRLPFGAPSWLVYAVWGSIVLVLPFLAYTGQAYPELPGALLALVAVRALLEPRPGMVFLGIGATAAALLPWLQVRFTLIAVALAVSLAIRAWSTYGRPGPVLGVLLPLAGSHLAMALAFERWYGSPALDSQYVAGTNLDLEWAYRHSVGGLLSPEYGWFPFAPLHLLALTAAVFLCFRFGWWAIGATAVALGYLALVGSSVGIHTGYAFPARLQLVIVPFAGVALLGLLALVPWTRLLAAVLAIPTLALAVDGLRHPLDLYPGRNNELSVPSLPLAERLAFLWPHFADEPFGYPHWPHTLALILVPVALGVALGLGYRTQIAGTSSP